MPVCAGVFSAELVGSLKSWWDVILAFLRIAGPYWRSEPRWRAVLLTVVLVGLTVAQIGVPVAINIWILNLFDALEKHAMARFSYLLGLLLVIIIANVIIVNLHLRVKRRLQVGWREWLTKRISDEWMVSGRHYLLTYIPGEHDNPDGRIAEDVRLSTEYAIDLAHTLLYDALLLISFTKILWSLSEAPYLVFDDVAIDLPGYLVWIAVLYAGIGTVIALTLGRFLVRAVDRRQTSEANFRFGLVHARENSLGIALARGEAVERKHFLQLFQGAREAYDRVTAALAHMFYFSSSWSVLSQVFPTLIMAPRYMAGMISLGGLMQTAQAFQQAVAALSWAIDNLGKVADWRASVERIISLHESIRHFDERIAPNVGAGIELVTSDKPVLVFRDLSTATAKGDIEISGINAEIHAGDRVLVTGETGAAANLMKAVAGLWPWGRGRIELPVGANIFFMPPRPYMPADKLRNVVCYPVAPTERGEAAIHQALRLSGLDELIPRLDNAEKWDQALTADEQQRLGFARLLLHRPDWIFLEDATEALDPRGQLDMITLLQREFPAAAIVAIGHSDALCRFETRRFVVAREDGVLAMHETRLPLEMARVT